VRDAGGTDRDPPVLGFTAILCITLAAGAAGALNQWYETDLDGKMKRTAKRPLPSGRMTREAALHFGVGLGCFSVLLMGLAINVLSAVILAVSILFYVLVYTVWLKRRTPQNIVIGGAAGAFPPLIGWAAATGQIETLPVLLFALIFLWTPAAFLRARDVRADRLRGRRRADAAGGVRIPRHAHAHPALHRADGRGRDRALGAGADRCRLWRDRDAAQRLVRGAGGARRVERGHRSRRR
jgi:4-hydroxybenzoate polyprenyltransferase